MNHLNGNNTYPHPTFWMGRDGMPLACEEKIRALNEYLESIRELCQHTLEEAVQMGCSEHFVRVVLSDLMASLERTAPAPVPVS